LLTLLHRADGATCMHSTSLGIWLAFAGGISPVTTLMMLFPTAFTTGVHTPCRMTWAQLLQDGQSQLCWCHLKPSPLGTEPEGSARCEDGEHTR